MLKKSLALRVLTISFLLLALPLLINALIVFQKNYQDALLDAVFDIQDLVTYKAPLFGDLQPAKRPFLKLAMRYLNLKKEFPADPSQEWNRKLTSLAEIGNFFEAYLVKKDKNDHYIVVASNLENSVGKDMTAVLKYYVGISDKPFFTLVSYLPNKKGLTFTLGEVIEDEQKRPIGVLAVSSNITAKLQELLKVDAIPYTVQYAVLSRYGVIIAASDPDIVLQYMNPISLELKRIIEDTKIYGGGTLPAEPLKVTPIKPDKETADWLIQLKQKLYYFDWKNRRQIAVEDDVPETVYSIVAYATKGEIYLVPLKKYFTIYGIYAAVLLLGAAITYWLTLKMAKPLKQLSEVMGRVSMGDLSARYHKEKFGFEINELGGISNEMIESLISHMRREEEERVKKEVYLEELRIGQKVQMSLLPTVMPIYPGTLIAERYFPAKEVAGDYYDVFLKKAQNTDDDLLVLCVADATGKGISACLYSLGVRSIFRSFAAVYTDLGQIVEKTNTIFLKDTEDSGMFVTAVFGFYSSKTKIMSYYSCGHPPGILKRADGTLEILKHRGMALGFRGFQNVHEDKLQLQIGDLVLFYSDGVTESQNERNEFFGEERLFDIIKNQSWTSAEEAIEKISREVGRFAGKTLQFDDITLLALFVKS